MNCGIDFGTSNSALAVAQATSSTVANASSITLAAVEGTQTTLPSALFYSNSGQAYFGRRAMQAFMEGDEGRFMRSLKRLLGTSLMGQGTPVNGKIKKFDAILADFIRHMKTTAEAQFGRPLQNVVMGRPVHFADNDAATDSRAKAELEKIAKAAGFKQVEFQFEPIAAAFAHERNLTGEHLALVVDIGGGTSDFTVIRLSPQARDKLDRSSDILANSGIRIGGNDLDKDFCLGVFMPHFGYATTYGQKNLTLPVSPFHEMSEWSKINFLYTPKMRAQINSLYQQSHAQATFGRFVKVLQEETGHQLLSLVEHSKIDLTGCGETTVAFDYIESGFGITATRDSFNNTIEKHIVSISGCAGDCLQQSGLGTADIELIILTGGTTEVPLLKTALRRQFPQANFSEENKLSSVGLGLGYDSIRRFG
jgi:hypothetical chaperone protein